MRFLSLVLLITVSSLFLSGCCGECDGIDSGSFAVSTEGRTWTTYAIGTGQSRQFTDGNQTMIAAYDPPASVPENFAENCINNPRCGQCCDQYSGEAIFIALKSANGRPVFNITTRPDFVNYTPLTKPDDSGDYIEISADNKLTGRWFIPDPNAEATVTIIPGRTFTDVLTVSDNNITEPGEVSTLYFTRQNGIVGFKYGNGDTWALVP